MKLPEMTPAEAANYTRVEGKRPVSPMYGDENPPVKPSEIRAAAIFKRGRVEPAAALEILYNPRFGKQKTTEDWRNYIPDDMREIWLDVSPDARALLYFLAEAYGQKWEFEDDE